MRWRQMALTVMTAFLLAGCLPVTSEHPVGSTAGLGADRALAGRWRGHDAKNTSQRRCFLYIRPEKDASLMVRLETEAGQSPSDWMMLRVQTAKLGSNQILNAVLLSTNGRRAATHRPILLLYRHTGAELRLFLIDEDKARAAIAAGTIKGFIEKGRFGDVVLTADPAALDAFFARPEAAALFKPMLVARRME